MFCVTSEYYINKEKQQEQEKLLVEGYREMLKENEQDVEAYVKTLNDI